MTVWKEIKLKMMPRKELGQGGGNRQRYFFLGDEGG